MLIREFVAQKTGRTSKLLITQNYCKNKPITLLLRENLGLEVFNKQLKENFYPANNFIIVRQIRFYGN